MGNEFIINKTGLSVEEISSKFNHNPAEQITFMTNPSEFEANYKEPEFSVVDGHIQGGDFSAKEALDKLLSKVVTREEDEQIETQPVIETAGAAMEPCC